MRGHFKSEKNEGKTQNWPNFFIFHLYREVFQSLDHHSVHFSLHNLVDLNGVNSSKDRPVWQMQKNTNKLGIFFTFDQLESFIYFLLTKDKIIVFFDWRTLLLMLTLPFLKKWAEGFFIIIFLLGCNGEYSQRKLLIIFFQEYCDIRQLSIDRSLQFF